jgi:hypothetical protein
MQLEGWRVIRRDSWRLARLLIILASLSESTVLWSRDKPRKGTGFETGLGRISLG